MHSYFEEENTEQMFNPPKPCFLTKRGHPEGCHVDTLYTDSKKYLNMQIDDQQQEQLDDQQKKFQDDLGQDKEEEEQIEEEER